MSVFTQLPVFSPYAPTSGLTSHVDRRTWQILNLVWLLMVIQAVIFVARYSLVTPYVDEWAFLDALDGDTSCWTWFWELHNEHRFPLPRFIYYVLFQLTGDLRAGCYFSLIGVAFSAWLLMKLARKLRGYSHFGDCIFPTLLLHGGQGENFTMGYQLCFMLTVMFTVFQLWIYLTATPSNDARVPVLLVAISFANLMCGATGIIFGGVGFVWLCGVCFMRPVPTKVRVFVFVSCLIAVAYILCYRHGYERPAHHPPSAGFYESVRIGLQAQSIALGPAPTAIWPITGYLILITGLVILIWLFILFFNQPLKRPAILGLIGIWFGAAALSFGIGWGRSGFYDNMGFAWRYGWLTFPAIYCLWFTPVIAQYRFGRWIANLSGLLLLSATPMNIECGFRVAETDFREMEQELINRVCRGDDPADIARYQFGDDPVVIETVVHGMSKLHEMKYRYFVHLRVRPSP